MMAALTFCERARLPMSSISRPSSVSSFEWPSNLPRNTPPFASAKRRLLTVLLIAALHCGMIAFGVLYVTHGAQTISSSASSPVFLLRLLTKQAPIAPAPQSVAAVSASSPTRNIRHAHKTPPALVRMTAGAITVPQPSSSAEASVASPPRNDTAVIQSLDPDTLRKMAATNERTRMHGAREQIQQAEQSDHSIETRFGSATARAARPDCQRAYSGLGLLAVIPVVIDTVRDAGCKW